MIVSFVQTKGGTGKSTLSVNMVFSKIIAKKYKSVALVELDPQGTLNNWWGERIDEGRKTDNVSFHHISSTQKQVFQEGIKTIAGHNELIILDIPGESIGKLHTRFACAFSDLIVIPMRTSTNDESAFSDNLYPIIKEIVKVDPPKKGSFVILPAFTHPQSNNQKIFDYFKEILPDSVKCMNVVYPLRSVYENFNREGMNLKEYAEMVKTNRKYQKQAFNALKDVEEIAGNIIEILEKKNGSTKNKKKTR